MSVSPRGLHLLTLYLVACEGESPAPLLKRSGEVDRARAAEGTVVVADGADWTSNSTPSVVVTPYTDTTQICVSLRASCTSWRTVTTNPSVTLERTSRPQTVSVWFRDGAGTVRGPATDEVRLDGQGPTPGTLSTRAASPGITLAWTGFSDAISGVASYRVVGQEGTAAPYCHRTEKILYEGTALETTLLTLPPRQHAFRVCAFDRAGNISLGATATGTPAGEENAPVVSGFVIAGEAAAVSSRTTTLTATVADASSTGLEWCASEEATDATGCTSWRAWSPPVAYELSGGEEEKTVRAWVRDLYGNVSSTQTDSVLFDRTGPTGGSVELSGSAAGMRVAWTGFSDALSTVASYNVRVAYDRAPADCASGTLVYSGSARETTVTGLSGGRWAARVCPVDAAGNEGSGVTGNTTLLAEYAPPTLSRFALLGGGTTVWNDRAIELEIVASDTNGITHMCLAERGTTCTWVTFDAQPSFTLSAGDGTKVLELKLRDGLGNESSPAHSLSLSFATERDEDGDGVSSRTDCDDRNSSRFPGNAEVCDGVDNDCNGSEPTVCSCTSVSSTGLIEDHDYKFCTAATTQANAQAACESANMSLITISTAAENDWFRSAWYARSGGTPWIGFQDITTENSWIWEDSSDIVYRHWSAGEPNNAGNEDCTHFYSNGYWNDIPCGINLPYACEEVDLRDWFTDADGDGYGGEGEWLRLGTDDIGVGVGNEDDCDDTRYEQNPGVDCSGGYFESCQQILSEAPGAPDDVYTLQTTGAPFEATCDMTGGGWTLAYEEDFESSVGAEWNLNVRTACGYWGSWILGGYNGTGPSTYDNSIMPDVVGTIPLGGIPHTEVKSRTWSVIVDSWDNHALAVNHDGSQVWRQTLYWSDGITPGRSWCGRTWWFEGIRQIDASSAHTRDTLSLTYLPESDQVVNDEAWGIDSVEVWVR